MGAADVIRSVIRRHDKDVLTPMITPFGENIDTASPLKEYPRPQLVRNSYINLNGYWDYAICGMAVRPDEWEGRILVPFSPESELSGVRRQLKPDEYLWYRRPLPARPQKDMRLILHFGAVDYKADVFVNDTLLSHHRGGYLPFSCDIAPALKDDDNVLYVRVKDPTDEGTQSRGKQVLKRGGIFYTGQSGIWQSVWMEWVPVTCIRRVLFNTDIDKGEVELDIASYLCDTDGSVKGRVKRTDKRGADLKVRIYDPLHPEKLIVCSEQRIESNTFKCSFRIADEHIRLWTPEHPYLYKVELILRPDDEGGDKRADVVSSYFAMRSYSIEKKDGIPRFCLNHKPYFLHGVLDQGYWSDGLYTAPSDEALLYDIRSAREAGFNMIRKHLKVENPRFYYYCDTYGMIVCQDMINGGGKYRMPLINYIPTLFPKLARKISDEQYHLFARLDKKGRKEWIKDTLDIVSYLRFFPCIAIWCLFNEGWGQFDAVKITDKIRKLDPSRLIDSTSGWFDQGCGDFISVHNYFRKLEVNILKWENRAFLLSEYGGYACYIDGHSAVNRIFGYKRFSSIEDFKAAYKELMDSVKGLEKDGLSGAVFTQLTDVEEEVNGLMTYDRRVRKI